MKHCAICGLEMAPQFNFKILNKYDITYFHCPGCHFIQTEDPYWLPEAYTDAINAYDTGILQRNISTARVLQALIFFLKKYPGRYLDWGGGYGILTRLMRDKGFDFYWHDEYAKNLLTKGFSLIDLPENEQKNFLLVSAVEVFEHLPDPVTQVKKMLSFSDTVFFTTDLMPPDALPSKDWWYFSPEHGQHISFYSKKALERIAKKVGAPLLTNGKNIHLLTKTKINPLFFKTVVKYGKYLSTLISFFNKGRLINNNS